MTQPPGWRQPRPYQPQGQYPPQQAPRRPPYPHQHNGYPPPAPQQWGPPSVGQRYATNAPVQLPAPAKRRKRRVWPWVLGIALTLTPILMIGGCMAIIGGAATAVSNATKGGTVNIGETFTFGSGEAFTVSAPKPYPAGDFQVAANEQAYETTVTVKNGTTSAFGAATISIHATVNGTPAPEVYTSASLAGQQIAPGQSLAIPFRFKVAKGTTGSLQIDVRDFISDPVFFNGTL